MNKTIRKILITFAIIAGISNTPVQGIGITSAFAGQIANVDYIHSAIYAARGVTVPINASNTAQAANVKYMLCAVDKANEIINGATLFAGMEKYCNHTLATQQVIDTVAVNDAVARLIEEVSQDNGFQITLTRMDAGESFSFDISASGNFTIDWGDGGAVETVTKSSTTNTTYTHTYASDGNYVVTLKGLATGYTWDPAISFNVNYSCNAKLTGIEGDLGKIFPIIPSASFMTFDSTFRDCTGLKSIPENLFASVKGAPSYSNMFSSTFAGCIRLTSIPEKLFASIKGAPTSQMFMNTFYGCTGITSIPEKLFENIKGAPAFMLFTNTFSGCTGIDSIPENLFAGITGAPAFGMFNGTFSNCTGLNSIPGNLFAGIVGAPESNMFAATFYECSGITGSIPENLFAGIVGAPAWGMFDSTFSGCTGLSGSIPSNLFSGIVGAPANGMFSNTFADCSGLTGEIPGDLFKGIVGAPAWGMFSNTFRGCSGLQGEIPGNLFAGINGTPEAAMFGSTFQSCSNITGIGDGLFNGISGSLQFNSFGFAFYDCTSLTGPSAKSDGQFLYDKWPGATSGEVGSTYRNTTGLSDWANIPSAWM